MLAICSLPIRATVIIFMDNELILNVIKEPRTGGLMAKFITFIICGIFLVILDYFLNKYGFMSIRFIEFYFIGASYFMILIVGRLYNDCADKVEFNRMIKAANTDQKELLTRFYNTVEKTMISDSIVDANIAEKCNTEYLTVFSIDRHEFYNKYVIALTDKGYKLLHNCKL